MRAYLRDLVRAFLRRAAHSADVDGLSILVDARDRLPKVLEALRLIRERDPRRYARLVKDLRSIWTTLLPGPLGRFNGSDWTCELDERFVARSSVEQIASVIVHEATHARLWRRGVRYEPEIRSRVEAVCFRQQRAFADRLPAASSLAEELDAYLALPETFWSDRSLLRQHVRGSVAALRQIGLLRWLIGFVLRRHCAMRRRQRRAGTAASA